MAIVDEDMNSSDRVPTFIFEMVNQLRAKDKGLFISNLFSLITSLEAPKQKNIALSFNPSVAQSQLDPFSGTFPNMTWPRTNPYRSRRRQRNIYQNIT